MITQSGASDFGTPPVRWARYPPIPCALICAYCVMRKVKTAIITVTEMFAVAVAANGTRPNRFRKRMKKKAETRYGTKRSASFAPMFFTAISVRTNCTSISMKL